MQETQNGNGQDSAEDTFVPKSPLEGVVRRRNPHDLKPHPLSVKLYGHEENTDLTKQIKRAGRILQPLLLTWDDRIIAGSSRQLSAFALKMIGVPTIEFPSRNESEIEYAVVASNTHRRKSKEVRVREFKEFKRLRKELGIKAGRPKGESRKPLDLPSGKLFANANNLPTKDATKAVFGVSHDTLLREEKVVDQIDRLEKNGKHEQAQQKRQELEGGKKPCTGGTPSKQEHKNSAIIKAFQFTDWRKPSFYQDVRNKGAGWYQRAKSKVDGFLEDIVNAFQPSKFNGFGQNDLVDYLEKWKTDNAVDEEYRLLLLGIAKAKAEYQPGQNS